jgi:DNA-binding transcriptional regulator YiaG
MTPEELRQAREALGLTAVQFAKAFDVNERTLRAWEKGGQRGPIPKLVSVVVRMQNRSFHSTKPRRPDHGGRKRRTLSRGRS